MIPVGTTVRVTLKGSYYDGNIGVVYKSDKAMSFVEVKFPKETKLKTFHYSELEITK
jgi:hypothetical protein